VVGYDAAAAGLDDNADLDNDADDINNDVNENACIQ
jgi:hypothetical protein